MFELTCISAFNKGQEKRKSRVQGVFGDYCIAAIWYDKMKPQAILQARWICTVISTYLFKTGVRQHPVPLAGGSSAVGLQRRAARCRCRPRADLLMQLSFKCSVTARTKERSFAFGCTAGSACAAGLLTDFLLCFFFSKRFPFDLRSYSSGSWGLK